MEKKKENIVLALIALIIGILGLILSWIPIVNNFAAVLAVIGFILAIISLIFNRKNKKTLSIVSLVISIVTFVIVLATQAFFATTIDDAVNKSDSSSKVAKKLMTLKHHKLLNKMSRKQQLSKSVKQLILMAYNSRLIKLISAKVQAIQHQMLVISMY